MGSIFGGPAGQESSQKFPSWTADLTRFAFGGQTPGPPGQPPSQGLIGDAYFGNQWAPSWSLFQDLGHLPIAAQRGGDATRALANLGTAQGFGNTSALANFGLGQMGQLQNLSGLIPGALDASNAYLGMVNRAAGGVPIPGMNAARVTDRALGELANTGIQGDLFQRAADLVRPEIRQAWSARGLGGSGMAAGDESETMQRMADSFAERAMQERIGLLGTAASALGPEVSERVGLTDAAIRQALGGGQLALGAAGMPSEILSRMMGVAGAPLDAAAIAAGLQMQPLTLAGLGSQLYNAGLQMPLSTVGGVYDVTRAPQIDLLSVLGGTQQSRSSPDYRGVLGIPKS